MIAIYPGSFDPATNGHYDIIERCSKKFDRVIVAILNNEKKSSLFTIEERLDVLKKLTNKFDNVDVKHFNGLLVDFAKETKADVVIRGLRAVSDYEYEMQMSMFNKSLYPDLETMFLVSRSDYSYISSSVIKEIASLGGDVKNFVSPEVEAMILKKFGR